MAKSAYRHILKTVKTHVTNEERKGYFKEFIAAQFRKNAGICDAAETQKKIQLANDWAFLAINVKKHKEMLLSYNIGVDRAAEQAARLKDTAKRVGLQLPKLYKEIEDERKAAEDNKQPS